ncbi:MAG: response regulator transcription factor [Nitrospirae bacterium]|nr:response regulator transcription factor [Nitrospirota bacterium]
MEKILIIDDDREMRMLLSDIVALQGCEAIAASDGIQALKEFRAHSPGIILLDIRLPGIDGMEVLKEIKKSNKNAVVIMLTGYGEIKDAVQAIKLGAFDYITKPIRNNDITTIIKEAVLIRQNSNNTHGISVREQEVLKWLIEGKSSEDISLILNISARTVKFHISGIMQKLNAVSRTQAVAIAIEKGIIAPR